MPSTVCCIAVTHQVLLLDGRALGVRHDSGALVPINLSRKGMVSRNNGQAAPPDGLVLDHPKESRTVLDVLLRILADAPHALLVVSAAIDGPGSDGAPFTEWDDRAPTAKTVPALTRRQLQVLAEMSGGVTEREIGWRLGISERTVQLHVANICKALGVRSQFQLGLAAAHLGVI